MDKLNTRDLNIYKKGNYTYYFLRDGNRWVGDVEYGDKPYTNFVAAAKLFGTKLIPIHVKSAYDLTQGESIYHYATGHVIYTPRSITAQELITNKYTVLFNINDGIPSNHLSGTAYIPLPMDMDTNSFVTAYVFDEDDDKYEIKYNINTGEAKYARRV